MSHHRTLMGIRHSPRTPYSPWTNGLVEVQNKNLGTHIRMFLQNTPKEWARFCTQPTTPFSTQCFTSRISLSYKT